MKMNDERNSYPVGEEPSTERDDETPRAEETGEASEPDAPVSAEENESMGTILDGEPTFGVQSDE
jgi:hypothetical protein